MQVIAEKDNQKVAEGFNAVIGELKRISDDMKMACANAAMEGDFEKMDAAKLSALALKSFSEELTMLSTRWNEGIFDEPAPESVFEIEPSQTGTPYFRYGSRVKSLPKKLTVTFLNNDKVIQQKNAVETFIRTLQLLKLEEVAKLKRQVAGYQLVSKTQHNPLPNNYRKCGDWYVHFPANTVAKQAVLLEISQALNIPLRVDAV